MSDRSQPGGHERGTTAEHPISKVIRDGKGGVADFGGKKFDQEGGDRAVGHRRETHQ